jgi:signal transduction histidine kinase
MKAEAHSRRLRALIVEDSPDDADLLCRALALDGYEITSERVQTAHDMQAAIRDHEWDIVFSDWTMPQFSAPAALEIVKQSDLDVPFIIVSGLIGEDLAVQAMKSGAHDFFQKDRLALLAPAVDRELREVAVRRERAQMQEQLMISDRMASVGLMAAGVAHEINNPLAAVIGNLTLALEDLDEIERDRGVTDGLRKVHAEVRNAQEAAERIRNVANDLQLFARSDVEDRGAVDVEHVIESSLRMAHNEIRHRARLRTTFSHVPPVDASESRLGQVFLNLIINAAQSIPEGAAEENEISVSTTLAADGAIVVAVRDTGSGMSADVKRQLFAPFFTTKPIGVGTGLGLSICQRIVTSMGGTITAESEPGNGSTFRVRLPPAVSTVLTATPVTMIARATARRGAVLTIDDERSIGLLIEAALCREHDVTVTTSARDALDWIGKGARYDTILCDLMMPHVTGMDFHSELTRIAPDQASRVIFLTGGAFSPQARQFLDDIDNHHISKPFDIAALRQTVNDHIERLMGGARAVA